MTKVRIGVVGAGLVAHAVHLPVLAALRDRFEVVGVADPDRDRRDAIAARHGVGLACAGHEELVDRAAPDALLVCSPNRTHADVVVHALSAGLHVLVEKPLCLTLADVDRILAARDRAGTVVQVGYMKRFDPAVERFLGDGLDGLGRLLHVATVTHDPGLARWFGPSPAPPSRPLDLLSDIFLGALVHDVNLVHGLLEAAGRSLPTEARDAFATLDGSAAGGAVELAPGVRWTMAWLRLDGLADFRERVEVYGTGGVAALEFPAPYILHAPTTYVRSTGGEQRRHRSWDEAYVRQLRHFHDCVTGRTPCRTPPEQARADITLLTALHARAGEREAVA